MRVVEGNVISVDEVFLDDNDEPIYPRDDSMGPIVSLIDPEGEIIAEVVATTSEIPGGWTADLAVPDMELVDDTIMMIRWRYETEEGLLRAKQDLTVEPAMENRVTDIVCLFGDDTTFDVMLPFHLNIQKDELKFQLSLNNEILMDNVSHKEAGVQMTANRAKTCSFRIPLWAASYRLEPMSLIAKHLRGDRKIERMYTVS